MDEETTGELAASIRDLANRLVRSEADDLETLRAALAPLLEELDAPDAGPSRFGRHGHVDPASHPLAAGRSGIFPPVDVEWRDGLLIGRTVFDAAWEGPSGLVHGGFLSTGFDLLFSTRAFRLIGPSVTRRLQLRYLRPTPLGASLRFEVETDSEAGRLLDQRGRLYADDRLTMRATAQFAAVAGDHGDHPRLRTPSGRS